MKSETEVVLIKEIFFSLLHNLPGGFSSLQDDVFVLLLWNRKIRHLDFLQSTVTMFQLNFDIGERSRIGRICSALGH